MFDFRFKTRVNITDEGDALTTIQREVMLDNNSNSFFSIKRQSMHIYTYIYIHRQQLR